jgi:hypothetical protein
MRILEQRAFCELEDPRDRQEQHPTPHFKFAKASRKHRQRQEAKEHQGKPLHERIEGAADPIG